MKYNRKLSKVQYLDKLNRIDTTLQLANISSTVMIMSNEVSVAQQFESIRAGFKLVSELESQVSENNDAQLQLEEARSYLAKASRDVESAGFEQGFLKAMGVASGVAIANECDDLAEDALGLGGENV
jgi:hypothetical protein